MNTMKTLILTVACCLMAIAQTQAKDFVRPESSNYCSGFYDIYYLEWSEMQYH